MHAPYLTLLKNHGGTKYGVILEKNDMRFQRWKKWQIVIKALIYANTQMITESRCVSNWIENKLPDFFKRLASKTLEILNPFFCCFVIP